MNQTLLQDEFSFLLKENNEEAIYKRLRDDCFIKEIEIHKDQDKLKVKLKDILGFTKNYNGEITLIHPVGRDTDWFIVGLKSTEAETK
jgi:hypothetical protein